MYETEGVSPYRLFYLPRTVRAFIVLARRLLNPAPSSLVDSQRIAPIDGRPYLQDGPATNSCRTFWHTIVQGTCTDPTPTYETTGRGDRQCIIQAGSQLYLHVCSQHFHFSALFTCVLVDFHRKINDTKHQLTSSP